MDNLTHSLTGLLLARAGLDRLTPRAHWVLLAAANAPDLDVVSAASGALAYLQYHRHGTHSLALLPLMALLGPVVVRVVSRRPLEWRGAYLASLAGVASHLALDWTNIYGVRLLLPFSERWLRLDITSVVDFWIWGALLGAFLWPWLSRLVASEIGSPDKRPGGRRLAMLALAFLALYDASRAALHARAVAVLETRVYGGEPVERAAATPGPANPFSWRGVVETASTWQVHEVNLLAEFDPSRGRVFPKPEPGPALEAARRSHTFREFLRFSQLPAWRVTPAPDPENAQQVEAIDMRFGSPAAPGFMAGALVSDRGEVLKTWFRFGRGEQTGR